MENKKLEHGDYTTGLTRNEWESITFGKHPFYSFATNGGMIFHEGKMHYRVFKDEVYNGLNKLGKLDFINRAKNTFV